MPPKKKIKTQEEIFKEDILKVTGDQQKKIDSFVEDMGNKMDGVIKNTESIAEAIKNQSQQTSPQPIELEKQDICAVLLMPEFPIPQEELNQKAQEVAKIIKPIMKKYQIKTLNVSVKR